MINSLLICLLAVATAYPEPECGILTPKKGIAKIYGGRDTLEGEWPWLVAIFVFVENIWIHICGGSLVTRIHIITAAHCTFQISSKNRYRAVVGQNNIAKPKMLKLANIIEHEDFLNFTLENDIAVVVLEDPVEYGPNVQPICLPTKDDLMGANLDGVTAWAAGWGLLENGSNPKTSQVVDIELNSFKLCKKCAYHASLTENDLCSTLHKKRVGKGDSGGPLVVLNGSNNKAILVGVTSRGDESPPNATSFCKIAVYVRIDKYLDWLEEAMNKC